MPSANPLLAHGSPGCERCSPEGVSCVRGMRAPTGDRHGGAGEEPPRGELAPPMEEEDTAEEAFARSAAAERPRGSGGSGECPPGESEKQSPSATGGVQARGCSTRITLSGMMLEVEPGCEPDHEPGSPGSRRLVGRSRPTRGDADAGRGSKCKCTDAGTGGRQRSPSDECARAMATFGWMGLVSASLCSSCSGLPSKLVGSRCTRIAYLSRVSLERWWNWTVVSMATPRDGQARPAAAHWGHAKPTHYFAFQTYRQASNDQ